MQASRTLHARQLMTVMHCTSCFGAWLSRCLHLQDFWSSECALKVGHAEACRVPEQCPQEVADLCHACMAKAPCDRPSAADMQVLSLPSAKNPKRNCEKHLICPCYMPVRQPLIASVLLLYASASSLPCASTSGIR